MAAGNHDLYIEQGVTFQYLITLKDEAGTLLPLPNHTARMQIRSSVAAPAKLHEMTTENGGITITNPGLLRLYISAINTSGFQFTSGVYDLELVDTSTGNVVRLLKGAVSVDPEVTR